MNWQERMSQGSSTHCIHVTLPSKERDAKFDSRKYGMATPRRRVIPSMKRLIDFAKKPGMQLVVRPLDVEEVLTATGIAEHVPSRQNLVPYRTPGLCRSLAGNSFHPNLILATVGGEGNLRAFVSGPDKRQAVDESIAAAPQLVAEHFATVLLGPILGDPERRSLLKKGWCVDESTLSKMRAYRRLHTTLAGDTERSPAPVQLGRPDDWVLHFSNATLAQECEQEQANRGLVPGVCSAEVHDYLIQAHQQRLLLALRATRFVNADRLTWVQELLGVAYERMLQELPHLSVQGNLTSLLSVSSSGGSCSLSTLSKSRPSKRLSLSIYPQLAHLAQSS